MAYAEQQGYRAAQRPQYQYPPNSDASLHQPHTAEYDYAPEPSDFNGRPRPGPPQQYRDEYELEGGDSSHDQDRWQGANGGVHGRRGRDDVGGPPVQPSRQRPADAHPYVDARNRGQARSKSRPPERTRNFGPEPQGFQQRHHPEPSFQNGSGGQYNGNYNYNEASYGHQDGWDMNQQYNTSMTGSQAYHGPQNGAEYRGKGHSDHSAQNAFQDYHEVIPESNSQGPPRSAHGKPPSVSSKSEISQRSRASNKRIIETPMSPETVAWDNPFPTFPMRPKKGAHSTAKSLDGSVAETNFRDQHRRDKNHDDRPQTASSKSSSNTIPQSQSTNESIYHSQNQNEGYFDRNARAQRDAHVDQPVGQGRPVPREPIHTGGGNNELKPPGVSGRHSEDNRTRPSIPIDPSPDSRFQRSRTMPTAIAEAALKPNSRPKPAIQTSWQEPGPVAGYHGPDDRGYTPTSPLGPIDPSQQRPYGQSRAISAEKRPYGHAAVQNPTLNSRQAHAPQDSFGDVLDGYYDRPAQQDHPSYSKTDHGHYRPTGDEEMPNFDAQPDPGATHRRGMTIDKHLQQPRSREQHPPVPDQLNQRSDMYINGPVPRSRSQPDLKDRRSPRQQHNDGFDFGVPGPSTRPPATAPARDDCGLGNAMPPPFTNPNDWPVHSKHYPMEQRPGGPAYTAGYRHDDWNVPPPRSGPPARGYQANAPPDRFRSPPQEGRPNGPSPMGYRDQHRPDRLRSPPLQGGPSRQGPTRPPNARPPPSNEHTVDGSLPVERQNNGRSPPIQDDRSRHGQMRPPGGGPSPNGRPGPSSTPPRSPINPDALPAHPAPVRAGLMEGSPVNQAAKPAPVRQYNATPSPMQLSDPSQKPGSSNSAESKRESVPVTHQELDRLKQATARNPNDMATQLILAKKLVEAAGVLVDERADSRTRSKSREKYILDAYKIVKKLSGNGYTGATFYLADCYTRGSMGLESDTREAFKLYQNAAKAGHPQAAYRVAVCCEIGQEEGGGTSRDPVKAMQWYKRAATLGDTPAMYKMGIVSLKGLLGQPKNPREAITWLKRAAERADQENPHALHELALLHEKPSGNDGVNKDEAYSRQLFTQAANLGYKFSQYRLGCIYEYGLMGGAVDPRQSIAWYSKAAVQEEHQSELALSGWYLTGSEGILQQSDTEAYLWARKAAQAGLAKAEYAMGYFTEVGIGAPANLEDAKRWYWRAASQNFPKARERLEDLRKGGPTKRKERVSRSNMRKSTEGECTVM